MLKVQSVKDIFTRYKNPYLSLERRFILPDKKSGQFIRDYNDYVMAPVGQKPMLKYIKTHLFNDFCILENHIDYLIENFTLDTASIDEIEKEKNLILKFFSDEVKDIQMNGRTAITIKMADREIKVRRLSDYLPDFSAKCPEIVTEERVGQCHGKSVKLLLDLEDNNAEIVTGPAYVLCPKSTFLHSWVEQEIDGVIYCFDFTSNSVMERDNYYYLMHTKIYERISRQQYLEDWDKILALLTVDEDYAKLYLSSRNEALKIAEEIKNADENV